MRALVRQWTGIPVRIGIAPNKTLSKIAINEIKRKNIPSQLSIYQIKIRLKTH